MQKKIILLLVFCLAVLFTACGKRTGDAGASGQKEKTLYEQGLEVISLMEAMTKSEAYLVNMSGSEEIREEIAKAVKGDYQQKPKAVYQIKIKNTLEAMQTKDIEELPEELREYMEEKVDGRGGLSNVLNAGGGVNRIAASSVCSAQKLFVSSELTENMSYLYVYPDTAPVWISFCTGEDGAVQASGSFVLREDFPCDTEEDVKEGLKMFETEIKTIDIPK